MSQHRIVLTNGTFHTMDSTRPTARSLVLDGELIAGLDEPHDPADPNLTVLDMGGRTVVPGFIDSHNHLSISALYPRWANLLSVRTPEQLRDVLARQAADEPDAEWIRGANWLPAMHGFVTRDLLDSFGFDRPIMLGGHSLHEGFVDTHGLERLQISATTSDPVHGLIERDARGEPTGWLIETAWSTAHAVSVRDYGDPERWAELIVRRAESFLRDGVTAVHDAACSPEAEAVYRQLASQGRLPLSVLGMPHPSAMLTDDLGPRLDGPPTGEGDPWYRVGPVKLFADGGALSAVSHPGDADRLVHGIYFASIEERIPLLYERGYRVGVHTVGDYAVRGALSAFRTVARRDDADHRFRLEHVNRPRREQIEQIRELGVVLSVQPGMIDYYGDRMLGAGPREITDAFLPIASFLEAGITVGVASDDPCAPFGPLRNAISGATRHTATGAVLGPAEAVPLTEWLHGYTAGSAYIGGQENERGRLMTGLRADLVVLEGTLTGETLPRVVETWVAGRCVWAERIEP